MTAFGALACSDGAVVNLGRKPDLPPDLPPGEPPVSRAGFGNVQPALDFGTGDDQNPTLDREMLTMYFNRGDPVAQVDPTMSLHNIHRAERDSTDEPFGMPEPITIATLPEDGPDEIVEYKSAAITLDGNYLWLAYERLDSDDTSADATSNIDVARASDDVFWFERRVDELNTAEYHERPRPLGAGASEMPLSRRLDMEGAPWITLFVVCEPNGECMKDDAAPLELEFEGEQDVPIVDGFLSENGLTFVFKGIVERKGVLYWTKREGLNEPWGVATPLPGEVNTPDGDERDPWLSEDEKTLFFAREGYIYRAEWLPETDGN